MVGSDRENKKQNWSMRKKKYWDRRWKNKKLYHKTVIQSEKLVRLFSQYGGRLNSESVMGDKTVWEKKTRITQKNM